MYCKNCGNEIPENTPFCSNCGAKTQEEITTPLDDDINTTPVEDSPTPTGKEKVLDIIKYKNCKNCGTKMPMRQNLCPKCNKKVKKPFYFRWWFIILILIVLSSVFGSIGGSSDKNKEKTTLGEIQNNTSDETEYTVLDKFGLKINIPTYFGDGTVKDNQISFSVGDYAILNIYAGQSNEKINAEKITQEYTNSFIEAGLKENNSSYEKISNQRIELDSLIGFTVKYYINTKNVYYDYAAIFNVDNSTVYILELGTASENNDYTEDFYEYIKTASVGTSQFEETTKSQTTPNSTTKTETTTKAPETTTESKVVTASFKETMDAYEAFMDEYIDFMKKYTSGSGDYMSMLSKYTSMLSQYTDWCTKIDNIDEDSLSAVDLAYYLEVTARVTKKLASVAF